MAVAALTAPAPAQDDLRALATLLVRASTPARGDTDALAAELLAGVVEHARSPASAVLAHHCHDLVPLVRDPAAFAARLRELAESKDLHGTTAAAVTGVAAQALQRCGRTDEAAALLGAAGFPKAVLVLGPFGDDGDHYLSQVFPPELSLDDIDVLAGRFGPVRPRVEPFDPMGRPGFGLRDPSTGHTGCYYALHQPVVADARACYLELFAPGSFEVFVNGRSVGRCNGYADPYTGWHWLPIVLAKGTNRVLVKTALNGFDHVALRYVDGAGRPIATGEDAAPERVAPLPATNDDAPPAPPAFVSPVAALDRAARAAEGGAAVVLHVATALAAAPSNDEARVLEHVLAAEKLGPASLEDKLGLACAFEKADLLPEEVRRSRARALLDGVREQVEAHAWAQEQAAQHLADEDKYEDAIRTLQKLVDGGQAGASVFARLHRFYERLEFRAEAARLRTRWLELFPGDAGAALAEADARTRDGDRLGARDVLVAARQVAAGDPQVNQRLLNLAVDQEDAELARAVHADIFRGRADSTDAVRTLAEVLGRLGDRAGAVRAWQRLAAHPEATSRDVVRAGTALLEADADAEGTAVLRAALERDPSQQTARKLLLRLGGSTEDYPALAPFRRDAAAVLAEFETSEAEKGAASTLVLDQMIVEFHADGSAVEEVHQVRRINDLSGVEKFQEADDAARADELAVLRTITPDGGHYVPHRVGGSYSMPRLAPGAFVEEAWRRFRDEPGADPWRGPEFHFQSTDEPYVLSELVVILPKGAPGSFRVRNFSGSPEVRTLDGERTAHVFTRRGVARLTPERLAPPTEEIVPLVTYGEDRAPGSAARRAYDYFLYRIRSSSLVDAKARELTEGLADDRAKVQAIHAFVHETIPTSRGPSDPTAVLIRRQGPRFWLEVALLRAAGVPMQLATAARTPEALDATPQPLFLGEAAYGTDAVLVLPGTSGESWLFQDDPRHWPLQRVAGERMGAAALLLGPDGWTPTKIPGGDSREQAGFVVRAEAVLDAEGTVTLTVDGTLRGRDGFAVADQLREREDNIKKLAARQVASQVLEGWSPREVELALDEPSQPLGLRGVLVKRRAVSVSGDASLLELPLGRRNWLKNLGDRAERQQPLALHALAAESWQVTIDPGESFRFTEVPQDILVRHPLLDYAQTFRLKDGKLIVRREWLQRAGRLEPALFGEWLDLLRRLDLAEDRKLGLAAR